MAVMGFQYRVTSVSQTLVHFFMAMFAAFYFSLGKFKLSLKFLIVIIVMSLTMLLNSYESHSPIPQVIFILSVIKGMLVGFSLYILVGAGRPKKMVSRLFKTFILIQLIVVFFQVFYGPETFEIWAPTQPDSVVRVANSSESWDGSSFGLFSSQVALGYFCLMSLVLVEKVVTPASQDYLIAIVAGFCIVSTFSLAVTACFFFYILATRISLVAAVLVAIASALLLSSFLWSVLNIGGLSLDAYVEVARDNRLGILIETLPKFFGLSVHEILFGLGYSNENLQRFLVSGSAPPMIFVHDGNSTALQDVYHVAILIYFGLLGFLVYVYALWSVASFGYLQSKAHREAIFWMLFFALVLGFFNQVWNVVVFSSLFSFSLLCIWNEASVGERRAAYL